MPANIYHGTSQNLRRLAQVLRRGGLVAVPTETVYGLAANALDAKACRQVFRAKRRPANDPLIVHVADLRMLARIAAPNDAVAKLARAFWPGPLTLVLARTSAVPDVVTAGLPSVAVRMPQSSRRCCTEAGSASCAKAWWTRRGNGSVLDNDISRRRGAE